MVGQAIGFVGAGRVARIILGGLKKAGRMPAKIVASDVNADVLKQLKSAFPGHRQFSITTARLHPRIWFFWDCIRRPCRAHSPKSRIP